MRPLRLLSLGERESFFFDLNEWKLIGRAGHVTGFFNEKSDKFHFFCLANRKLCLLSVCSRNNSRPCTKRRLPLRCTCRRVVRLPSDPLKVTVSFIFSLNSFFKKKISKKNRKRPIDGVGHLNEWSESIEWNKSAERKRETQNVRPAGTEQKWRRASFRDFLWKNHGFSDFVEKQNRSDSTAGG